MMKTTRVLAIGAMIVMAGVTSAEDKPAAGKSKKFDAAKLIGEWKLVGGLKAGEKPSDEAAKGSISITKDKITLKDGGDLTFVLSYKIGDGTPATIDLEIVEPKDFTAKAKGIVKQQGDTFTLCYDPTTGKRPAKFESTKENGFHLFTLKKATPKK